MIDDKAYKENEDIPLSPEAVLFEAAKAFAEGRGFRRANITISVNAASKAWYHIHAGPTGVAVPSFSRRAGSSGSAVSIETSPILLVGREPGTIRARASPAARVPIQAVAGQYYSNIKPN